MKRNQKGVRSALKKRQQKKDDAMAEQALLDQQAAIDADARAAEALENRRHAVNVALFYLKEQGLSFGDFIEHVSNPKNGQGSARWHGFFSKRSQVERVLDLWANQSATDGQNTVRSWAVGLVEKIVQQEASKTSNSGLLRVPETGINAAFFRGFNLGSTHEQLSSTAPTSMRIFEAFATSLRQIKTAGDARFGRKRQVLSKHLNVAIPM